MQYRIEVERDGDSWLAEVMDLHGVMAFGATPDEAVRNAEILALQVIADLMKHGEMPVVQPLNISFLRVAAA